jgi:hypothetical protein|tara:strand:- start:1561 stop:2796 length:1236 start_codon:yes stop_codon:yes gene_type:complete
MHFDKIEDYDFDHGLSFNTQTGEYHSLNPHDLARPLSHVEMDYNLMYQKQTLNGWRIAGSNADLTLNATDLGKVLAFHKVEVNSFDDPGNVMYDRHIAAGLFDGQLIWIPAQFGAFATTTIDPCAGFEVGGVSWTNSLAYQGEAATYNVVPNNTTTAEGNMVTFAINTTGVDNGTVIGWTLGAPQSTEVPTAVTNATAAPANFGANQYYGGEENRNDDSSGDGGGVSITDTNASEFTALDVVGGQVSGQATIQDDLGTVIIQILLDTVAEQSELMVFTLATTDSAGNATGSAFATVNIINIANAPTENRPPCNDDIIVSINECDDDITAVINECIDDIASSINEGGSSGSGSGGGSGVSGSGAGGGFVIATTQATLATTQVTQATQATIPPTLGSGGGGLNNVGEGKNPNY